MTEQDTEERRKKLVEKMTSERGYMPPGLTYLAGKDADFVEAYNGLYGCALKGGKALPVKTREFIALAILAYRNYPDGVYEHAKRALRNGATMQELVEAFETMMIPGGGPTLAVGLTALMRIEAEEKKQKPAD
jgi:alkylhydroperoxidase/carboxymuconolactone decarboxylase family protein YurZ